MKQKQVSAIRNNLFLLNHKDKSVAGQINKVENSNKSNLKWNVVNFIEEQFIRSANFIRKHWSHIFSPSIPKGPYGTKNQSVSPHGTTTLSDQQPPFSFLSFFAQNEIVVEKKRPAVAAILNESSESVLRYDLTLMTIHPDNWRAMVEAERPDLLIVEAPPGGHHGSWEYNAVTTSGASGSAFAALLQWTGKNGIPSMFWLSCDPQDEVRYFETAKLFDFILVSNVQLIDNYKSIFGNDKVLPFPNAIQPRIQNPVSKSKDGLFACSSDNLQNIKAYYGYEGLLNIGLQDKPDSLFPRNVVSSLACGIPVISANVKLSQSPFAGVVLFADTETDTQKYLHLMQNDPLARMKISIRGIRRVMETHRFDLRLSEVFVSAGLKFDTVSLPDICLLLDVTNSNDPDSIAQTVSKQTYQPREIVLFSENEPDQKFAERFASLVGPVRIHTFSYYQNRLSNFILTKSPCQYFAMWNDVDVYGPEYLKDYALATLYSEAPGYGKSSFYAWDNGQLKAQNSGRQYQFTSGVPVGTLMLRRDHLATFHFLSLLNPDGYYDAFIPEILALDPLNFIRNTSLTGIAENVRECVFA